MCSSDLVEHRHDEMRANAGWPRHAMVDHDSGHQQCSISVRMLFLLTWGMFAVATLAPLRGQAGEKNNWPSFRGPSAAGGLDGLDLPDQWNAERGEGIRFKVELPGLAHSSPVIWGDRLFLTTAVSSVGDTAFKPGLYGSGEASRDR